MVGKSLLINTTERLKRVSVTDPTVADALVVTPTQVLVNGLAPGEVSLLIWDELERSRSFDLRVDVDITAASEEMHRLFPDEQINVTPSRSAIVLSGHVTTEDVFKHAGLLASAYSKNVVNVLTFGPVGADEVLLEVKLASTYFPLALETPSAQCKPDNSAESNPDPSVIRQRLTRPPFRTHLTCFSLTLRSTWAQ
jgi:pilus assembly protein CpaC